LVGVALLLRSGVQASETSQPTFYTAKEWKEVYSTVRAAFAGQGVCEVNVVYRWDGPTPLTLKAEKVKLSLLGLTDKEAEGLPSEVLQPDPTAWAELMGSEHWVPTGQKPPHSSVLDPNPPNCQICVIVPPSGASYAICDGACEPPEVCNPDATGTYCGCAASGQPPTGEPSYCHGSLTHVHGSTWQWNCHPQSACVSPSKCDILDFIDSNGYKHIYCGCL
jgi:hypothetical protein